jgi:hypothetical protein
MTNWTELASGFTQPAGDVSALWIPVRDTFAGIPHLRIRATGSWSAIGGMLPQSGPDGLSGVAFEDAQLILAKCPAGALLGKFGGSSASHVIPADTTLEIAEQHPFAIGSHCVVKVPENGLGPLFVGFNCTYRPIAIQTLTIDFAKPG